VVSHELDTLLVAGNGRVLSGNKLVEIPLDFAGAPRRSEALGFDDRKSLAVLVDGRVSGSV